MLGISRMDLGAVPKPAPTDDRPNIVVIQTDDQDLDSVQYLPEVRKLADQGMTFRNYLMTTPICCPSRTSLLRGQYTHNHHVFYNFAPGGAFPEYLL